jgi:hypothetical protein
MRSSGRASSPLGWLTIGLSQIVASPNDFPEVSTILIILIANASFGVQVLKILKRNLFFNIHYLKMSSFHSEMKTRSPLSTPPSIPRWHEPRPAGL